MRRRSAPYADMHDDAEQLQKAMPARRHRAFFLSIFAAASFIFVRYADMLRDQLSPAPPEKMPARQLTLSAYISAQYCLFRKATNNTKPFSRAFIYFTQICHDDFIIGPLARYDGLTFTFHGQAFQHLVFRMRAFISAGHNATGQFTTFL